MIKKKRHFTFDVESEVTRKELKDFFELHFRVTVVAMASDPRVLPGEVIFMPAGEITIVYKY